MTVLHLFNTDPALKMTVFLKLRQIPLSFHYHRYRSLSNEVLLVFAPPYPLNISESISFIMKLLVLYHKKDGIAKMSKGMN